MSRNGSSRKRKRCVVCDARFLPRRSDARYCSAACRQKAHRSREAQDGLLREIEAARWRYWRLVWQLHAGDGDAVTNLSQLVDTDGNVWAYNGDERAAFGCGQWVGQIAPARAGWSGWGLEAAGAPFSPPPTEPVTTRNGKGRSREGRDA